MSSELKDEDDPEAKEGLSFQARERASALREREPLPPLASGDCPRTPTPPTCFWKSRKPTWMNPGLQRGMGADNMVLSQRQIIQAEETEYRFQAHAHTLKATDT